MVDSVSGNRGVFGPLEPTGNQSILKDVLPNSFTIAEGMGSCPPLTPEEEAWQEGLKRLGPHPDIREKDTPYSRNARVLMGADTIGGEGAQETVIAFIDTSLEQMIKDKADLL